MEMVMEKPTKKDRELAKHYLKQFEEALESNPADSLTEIRFKDTAEVVKVPKKAMHLFTAIISQIADGHGVKLIDPDELLSSQEAADYLHISRPHLIKLLDKGEIPYILTGTHRRIALPDVENYKKKLTANRERQLAFLAKQAQKLDLGY